MNEQYYYAVDGKRNGPVSFDILRELATRAELKRTHQVWWPGMKKWEPATSVETLFDDLPPDLVVETVLSSQSVPRDPGKAALPIVATVETAPSMLAESAVKEHNSSARAKGASEENRRVQKTESPQFSPRALWVIWTITSLVVIIIGISLIPSVRFLMGRGPGPAEDTIPRKPTEGASGSASYHPSTAQWSSGEQRYSGPSPEAIRNDRINAEREKRFKADVQEIARQLRATTAYSDSVIASMAPKIVEKARRDHVALQYGRGPGPSDEEIEEMVYASRKVVDRLP